MTGHIFLSYSHASDSAYVELLAAHLNRQSVPTWFDRDIISGDRWASVIRAQIDSCAAFVLVMSPTAEESVWVNREINQAEAMSKPIYPLLLKASRFFRLSDVQYEDVTGGTMPSARFADQLRNHLNAQTSQKTPPPDNATLNRQFKDAVTMSERGDPSGAAQILSYVVDGRTSSLGADHTATLEAREHLAINLGQSGDFAHAAEQLRKLIPDVTRVLGADHNNTLVIRQHLAVHLGESGDLAGAVKLLRELIPDLTRVLGADHNNTLAARGNLANILGLSGNRAGAVKLLRELIPDMTRVLGADHASTLVARYILANNLVESGNSAGAAKLLRELIPDVTRVLGPDHTYTHQTIEAMRSLINKDLN